MAHDVINIQMDTHCLSLIKITNNIYFSFRTSVPILSKRPKPFTCSSDYALAVNGQLSDPTLIKTTTENIKMEKSSIAIQPGETTGISDTY